MTPATPRQAVVRAIVTLVCMYAYIHLAAWVMQFAVDHKY